MIPRLKPYLGKAELLAILRRQKGAVASFEEAFARTFETQHALAFPYGRSALWAFFKAAGIEGAEVMMPAYTCVVVAHAIVLSGNTPRFVDITLHDYNMDLGQAEAAINERTRAIVATHLFGYPLDVNRLNEIVRVAETRWGHKIWVIQDCAHAFGARWQGKLVCNAGDGALFGLNISKMMTAVFGGLITTNDAELDSKLRAFREAHFGQPGWLKSMRRFLYLLAVYPAFNERLYGLVEWLQEQTTFLDHLTKAYHLDEAIHFPPDYLDRMIALEAKVGLSQLRKYPEIVARRQENACYYDHALRGLGLELPPLIDGATYSHYVARVPDRQGLLRALRQQGVQLGELIQYSVPHMAAYRSYTEDRPFPHAWRCSQSTINVPVHAHLTATQRTRVAESLRTAVASLAPSRFSYAVTGTNDRPGDSKTCIVSHDRQ